jgi:hypothetical protein
LNANGAAEGRDFDRITLSRLFDPVHWRHESLPEIVSYDMRLSELTSVAHKQDLRVRTATVLGVIRRKYAAAVAFLPPKPYREVFGPVAAAFKSHVTEEIKDVPNLVVSA